MSNNNTKNIITINNLDQELKSSQEKLKKILIKNDSNKLQSELNYIFNILITSEISLFSKNSYTYLKNIIDIIEKFLLKKNLEINLIIIKEIYFLLSNIKSKEILTYIFSIQNNTNNEQKINMNIFDNIISINDYNENEEFLNHQVNLMKSLILKLDSDTIKYFYKSEINFFPILNKSLLLYDHPESMLRGVIHNIILLITKNKNESLKEYLTSFPVALYYLIIIYDLKKIISELNFIYIKEKNAFDYFEEKHEDLYDTVLYINDILYCNIENINFILINCLLSEIIFPLFNVIISKKKENISVINAIYVLAFIIYYIKNNFLINIICYFLLNNKIPSVFIEKIEKYKYLPIDLEFIDEINFFIKNVIYADINDETWKRNSDLIKLTIGIDLSTGDKLEDNNYDYFRNEMINIKENKSNDIDFIENDIFICLWELMTSQDENIILNINILFYNIINYYIDYLKNCNNEILDSDEDIKKNKIKTAIIETNDLNQINNRSSTKINDKNAYINNTKVLFNPFLLPFINFSKFNDINNNIHLLNCILNSIKKRNKFRIFTNELLLNTLLLIIKIFDLQQNNMKRKIYSLNKEIKLILKEEINNIKTILNNESKNLNFNNIFSIYKYYKDFPFESKISDTMKSHYILTIPFMHLEKDERIPFSLAEEKSNENIIKNNMLNIFILLEIIQKINKLNSNDVLFNIFEKEKEKENINIYEIGKIYNKNNLGNEYAFCFIGNNYDDFKFNVQSIKKCLFIFSEFYFYLGEIISKTFKNISDIKILNTIPIISLNINTSSNSKNFLEINDKRNKNKIIMNCFDDDNTQKVFNYFNFMINNIYDLKKKEFNLFFNNIENKILK